MLPQPARVLEDICTDRAFLSLWQRARRDLDRCVGFEIGWADLDEDGEQIVRAVEHHNPLVGVFDMLALVGVSRALEAQVPECEMAHEVVFDEEQGEPVLRALFVFDREQDAQKVRHALRGQS